MVSRSTLVMGNWKMNLSLADARSLARGLVEAAPEIPGGEIVICPSPVHLASVAPTVAGTGLGLGAQDCVAEAPGAVTGGSSVDQLAELGVRWILVGHSERRALFAEEDFLLARKFTAVVAGGLRPVLCVGETLEERDAGRTAERVLAQVAAVLSGDPQPGFAVAYEPVWAIGTGRNARLADVIEVHELIRGWIAGHLGEELAEATSIIYGGSVNEANAAEYLGHPEIDGALVGGASLDVGRFLSICAAGADQSI
jgi:triosephosphate isomerase